MFYYPVQIMVSSSVEAVSIEPVVHQVVLDSVPSGADLFINGTIGGSTPPTLKVEEGAPEIQLVLEGYETLREFSITKDTQEEMVIRLREVLNDPKPERKDEDPDSASQAQTFTSNQKSSKKNITVPPKVRIEKGGSSTGQIEEKG